MIEARYEYAKVDAADKAEQARLSRLGYVQHGVRQDLRDGHQTVIKLRREKQ